MSIAEPRLTVVIPVWGARYLESLPRAIASVRAQDAAAELVVVDNASEAGVPEMPETTMVRSPRRLTEGGARNLGLERVASEFVVLLDADDELVAGALTLLLEGIEADPGVAVYAMSLFEAETGTRHKTPRALVPALTHARRLFALTTAVWSLYPIQGNAIMRTAWVHDAGGYPDSDDGEDWALAVSQAFRGRVVLDRRPGLIYHVPGQPSWRQSRGARQVLRAASQVRVRLRSDPGVPAWARAASPLVAVVQILLILAVRPLYRTVRAAFSAVPRRGGGASTGG